MTETAKPERDWLIKVAEGDERAFKVFYTEFWPQVYGTALHLTRTPELAKDLSQDVFVKVWEGRSKLTDIENIEAYIYTVSKNLVIDFFKKKVFDPANTDFLFQHFQAEADMVDLQLEYKETEYALRQAVGSLKGKVKDVFIMSREEGLTHEEIAERLSISTLSSKTYIVRALREIRKYLNTHEKSVVISIFIIFHFHHL